MAPDFHKANMQRGSPARTPAASAAGCRTFRRCTRRHAASVSGTRLVHRDEALDEGAWPAPHSFRRRGGAASAGTLETALHDGAREGLAPGGLAPANGVTSAIELATCELDRGRYACRTAGRRTPGKHVTARCAVRRQQPGPRRRLGPAVHPGFAYGPYLLNHYTRYDPSADVARIVYLMSTGKPYQVQVMEARITDLGS
jgi:hypothetical protein